MTSILPTNPAPASVVAGLADRYKGAHVTIPGTYVHSTHSVYDPADIIKTFVPSPVAGAKGVEVRGLTPEFIASLNPDFSGSTDERWGSVELTGTIDAVKGAAVLDVTAAKVVQPPAPKDPDDFGDVADFTDHASFGDVLDRGVPVGPPAGMAGPMF